jgi:hypothetical protein
MEMDWMEEVWMVEGRSLLRVLEGFVLDGSEGELKKKYRVQEEREERGLE